MVRVLADLTPTINKVYISQNRMLADRGVLPDMKAALRARSEFRPADDKELLPTFSRMLSEVGALPTDIVIPVLSDASVPGVPDMASGALPSASTPVGALRAPAATVNYTPGAGDPRGACGVGGSGQRRDAAQFATASPAAQETSPTSTR